MGMQPAHWSFITPLGLYVEIKKDFMLHSDTYLKTSLKENMMNVSYTFHVILVSVLTPIGPDQARHLNIKT